MQVWIALLRGINVGGANIVPMVDLRAMLADVGFESVKTYIQSGNVVFKSNLLREEIAIKVATAIEATFGFSPHLMILSLEELEQAIADNPFPEGKAEPKTLHLSFAKETPKKPNLTELAEWKKNSESFELKGKVFYLHAPEGIGRSKLAERAERMLGVAITARNWRSVGKILELAKAL